MRCQQPLSVPGLLSQFPLPAMHALRLSTEYSSSWVSATHIWDLDCYQLWFQFGQVPLTASIYGVNHGWEIPLSPSPSQIGKSFYSSNISELVTLRWTHISCLCLVSKWSLFLPNEQTFLFLRNLLNLHKLELEQKSNILTPN